MFAPPDMPSLLGVAKAMLDGTTLTRGEKCILAGADDRVDPSTVAKAIEAVRDGTDPLGSAFCIINSGDKRRDQGQTFTPDHVVRGMFGWAKRQREPVVRLVDPGAGTGRYTMAGLRVFPRATAVAVELDPVVALLLRANLAAAGMTKRVHVFVGDFRELSLDPVRGSTLFVGNPPSVRHHGISARWKAWYSRSLEQAGLTGSQLAGLHMHFFVKTKQLAAPGDLGCYVTAAEWLDVNYGSSLREMLANGLGGRDLFVVDPELRVFEDAMVTAAITGFAPGSKNPGLRFMPVHNAEQLRTLPQGESVASGTLKAERRWSILVRGDRTEAKADHIELGELFQVSRGQVTGLNKVWVENDSAPSLPARFLLPSITAAADITTAPSHEISSLEVLRRVVSLPRDLDGLADIDRKRVEEFLAWARTCGAHETYVALHRKPWWHVHLRQAAPIVMTYMGRRPPAFAYNRAGARLINVAHGLYPREAMALPQIRTLVTWLNKNVRQDAGRVYSGGLTKFEPGEAMRIQIPEFLTN